MDLLREKGPSFLQLSPQLWGQMVADVSERAPQEACGLVAGKENICLAVYPLTNLLHSPTQYRIDPQEQFETFQLIEDNGWDLLAIYHSHPLGPPGLSTRDLAEAFYPQAVYLVWYRSGDEWNCKGFLIQHLEPEEVAIFIKADKSSQASSSSSSTSSS